MTLQSAAAAQTALFQAQIRTQIATRLLRVARDMGRPQQMRARVEQAATATAGRARDAAASSAPRVDVLG